MLRLWANIEDAPPKARSQEGLCRAWGAVDIYKEGLRMVLGGRSFATKRHQTKGLRPLTNPIARRTGKGRFFRSPAEAVARRKCRNKAAPLASNGPAESGPKVKDKGLEVHWPKASGRQKGADLLKR